MHGVSAGVRLDKDVGFLVAIFRPLFTAFGHMTAALWVHVRSEHLLASFACSGNCAGLAHLVLLDFASRLQGREQIAAALRLDFAVHFRVAYHLRVVAGIRSLKVDTVLALER